MEYNNEQKEIKINIPEGFEIDKENSSFEKIVFKKKENILPTTWEKLEKIKGFYIDQGSNIISYPDYNAVEVNKNVYPTKKLAEAALALCQLLQLRNRYNDGWVADWENKEETKYCIIVIENVIKIIEYNITNRILYFKTMKLRDEFLNNFKDLLEIAKPLL